MRGVRAPIVCMLVALALPGCMRTTSPVATTQPQSDLDAMVYGQPAYYPAPVASVAPSSDSGGAIAALRASFAAPPPRSYAQAQYAPAQYAPAYAAAPMPVAYDSAYRLDAGDKLRVVVYGQEGLTNTYAIDAGGSTPCR
jgi:polysaccharide biosynthesis/export protein